MKMLLRNTENFLKKDRQLVKHTIYKKLISLLLMIVILISNSPVFAEESFGIFSYTEKDGYAVITGCEDTEGIVYIPSRIGELSVYELGSFAFMANSMNKAVIPSTVTHIMGGVFYSCENLQNINIPDSVSYIGDNAFYGCTGLKEITLPASVEYIGIDAFSLMGEDFVIYGYENTEAAKYAADNDIPFESLGEAEKNYVATGISGENAQWTLSALGVLNISGEGEISVPFSDEYKDKVKKLVISEGITKTCADAFSDCKALETVILPESLTVLGKSTFYNCPLIRSITLPGNLESIGASSFSSCTGLSGIEIPDTVTGLGASSFSNCTSLRMIDLSEGLTELPDSAFSGCSSLSYVEIPGSVKSIYNSVFEDCTSLSTVILNDGLVNIYNYAFERTVLSELAIPKTVKTIQDILRNCSVLPVIKGYTNSVAEEFASDNNLTFVSLGELPDETVGKGDCGDNVQWSLDSYGNLVIKGTGATDSYSSSSAQPWYEYQVTSIEIKEGITSIGDNFFYGLKSVKSVSFPSTLKEIGYYSFAYCTSLESVNIPEGVISLGVCAFSNCTGLSNVYLPESLISMPCAYYTYSFYRCKSTLTVHGYEGSIGEFGAKENSKTFVIRERGEEKEVISATTDEGITFLITNRGKLTLYADEPVVLDSNTAYLWNEYNGVAEIYIGKNIAVAESKSFRDYNIIKKVTVSEWVAGLSSDCFYLCNSDFTVYGYDNSAAEKFAESEGLLFVSLGELPECAVVYGDYSETVHWEITNKGVLKVTGEGEIPGGTPSWNDNFRELITSIVVSEGITAIGGSSLANTYNATEITISYTVGSIDYGAFEYGLTVKGYENSVAHIWAEDNEYNFVSIGEMPYGVMFKKECGDSCEYVLYTNGDLEINGTGYVNTSPDYIEKKMIKKVTVSEGITGISDSFFDDCVNMTQIYLPSTMTGSHGSLFENCSSLSEVKLSPFSSLSSGLFSYCTSLTKVTVASGTKNINSYVFNECPLVQEVVIPSSVTYIDYSAFYGCAANLKIYGYEGSKAQSFANSCGYRFVSLGREPLSSDVEGTYGNISWKLSTDGVLTLSGEGELSYTYNYPWKSYKDYITKAVISGGIVNVPGSCFSGYKYLKEVTLSSTVERIDSDGFSSCSALEKIELSDNLSYIGPYAFYGCFALKEITVPKYTYVESYAFFADTGILVKGYTGSSAHRRSLSEGFLFESMGVLEKEVIEEGVLSDSVKWSYNTYAELVIEGEGTMPDFSEGEAPWLSLPAETVVISEGITSVGAYSFMDMRTLCSVDLPKTLEVVGEYSFYGDYKLQFIYMPEKVKVLGDYAFYEVCYGMALGDNIEIIGENTFSYTRIYANPGGYVEEYCKTKDGISFISAFSEGSCGDNIYWCFDIYDGVLEISGSGDMYDYINSYGDTIAPWAEMRGDIKSVNISEGITSVGAGVFQAFLMKSELKLPLTVKSVGEAAFKYSEFSSVVIPEGCTEIKDSAFNYTSISSVTVPSTVTTIGVNAFSNSDSLCIYTPKGSYAESYANTMGIKVVALKGAPVITSLESDNLSGNIAVYVKGENLSGYKGYAFLYDEEGAFVSQTELSGSDESLYGTFKDKDGHRVKCVIWESLESMKPLCPYVETEVIKVPANPGSTPSGGGGGGGGTASGGTTSGGSTSGGTVIGGVTAEAGAE